MNGWILFWDIVLYIAMEGVAWLSHRYLMHGLDMAQRSSSKDPTSFELNDLFFIVYAVPSAMLIITGLVYSLPFGLGAGFGYFMV